MDNNFIFIKGARQHNLKNIDLKIPRNKLVCITGVSGSGKSTLAFDTIYAEGQRRYVESLSAYARQFLGRMDKPDVEYIEGLSPAISIDQKGAPRNPRSTVGTVTEIHDYLRLLFARIGIPHCYKCGKIISSMTIPQMLSKLISTLSPGSKFMILAPAVRGRKGEHTKQILHSFSKGYSRIRVDGEIYESPEEITLDRNKKHNIEIVIDRLIMTDSFHKRISSSLETALSESGGLVIISPVGGEDILFSEKLSCPDCDISIEELQPRFFSFNSPYGACPACAGLGETMELDTTLIVPDGKLSISEGAIAPWGKMVLKHKRFDDKESIFWTRFSDFANDNNIDINAPFDSLSLEHRHLILYGNGGRSLYSYDYEKGFEGAVTNLQRRHLETDSDFIRNMIERYMTKKPCPACEGKRLRPEVLAVTVNGLNISQFSALTIGEALDFADSSQLSDMELKISYQILKEIRARLAFLKNVGLDYLTLDRGAVTLSGGEAQRIRLATQIGSGLTGVLYVLDEPSIGLHQRDNSRLINTMKSLRDLGNTVIVVEHDEETIESSDFIVDIGPGAGVHGGEITACGSLSNIKKEKRSVTGQYLSGFLSIPLPETRRKPKEKYITIYGAQENNLKNIDIKIPLGLFVCITGVSGSGKSTLVDDILYKSLSKKLYRSQDKPGKADRIDGIENIDKVIIIDQSPIGRTPRSNPATYTGAFTPIRELFAQTRDAKMYGYNPGRFSFNVKGGRCEACQGDGIIRIEMHFLPDVYVPCEECKGKRYSSSTLDVCFKGKNISDVLEMTVEEASIFFENIPAIARKLRFLYDVGLGYIKLGQSATTLSGGEAQRVKLATELSKKATGRTLYILDEPTTGLHFDDTAKLLDVLQRLVSSGNTVLLIEHNMDVIKSSDYIIDLGPEGGSGGGMLVACGTPEEIADVCESHTGRFLKKYLLDKDI